MTAERGRLALLVQVLAETPDDAPRIDELLQRIAVAATGLPGVDYASVTATRAGAPATVALSEEVIQAVDDAQYQDQAGPCLDALHFGRAVSAPDVATTSWPRFSEAAVKMGLLASLSVPLLGGSGKTIAALNLYSRHPQQLAPLTDALLSMVDDEGGVAMPPTEQLDAVSADLLAGIFDAVAIQHRIQVAVGMLMGRGNIAADDAYLQLLDRAAAAGVSLLRAAEHLTSQSGN